MSTSGTTTYSTTRDDIIKRALRLIGVLAQGETPTADQVSEASVALNGLVKAWQADGMPLWAISTLPVTLVAGKSTYTIGTAVTNDIVNDKPLKVMQCWNHNSTSNVDIPMRILTQNEYNRLGNKTSSGSPIQMYYQPNRDNGTLYLFPVPASTDAASQTLRLVYQRPYQDFNASTDAPDFPQEWYDAVTYGLASRLAPEYGIPAADRKTLWQETSVIKQEALSFGTEEGSLYFQVDRRSW